MHKLMMNGTHRASGAHGLGKRNQSIVNYGGCVMLIIIYRLG